MNHKTKGGNRTTDRKLSGTQSLGFHEAIPDGVTEYTYALLHGDTPGSGTRPKSARHLQLEAVQFRQCEGKRRVSFSEMNARIPDQITSFQLS